MQPVTGLLTAMGVLLLAAVAGGVWKRRNGTFRSAAPTPAEVEPAGDPLLASLGVVPGTPVTLLQFSTAFCGPCRTTRVRCAEVAARVPGVSHVEVDAESHLDAVRALEIWRTPTVLVIDAAGRIRLRASGAPTRAQLLAAVADVVNPTP